ncbi:MAG: PD-(D/E)XK nuclease family protein [Planctomycetota bacterium]|nr:PD-(D/E)XK nuclease family protein [Planctomycetota bacterium]
MTSQPSLDMLDWTSQPLELAAERLVDRLGDHGPSETAVLVSGRRLRRLLQRELVRAHRRRHGRSALLAPVVLTPSGLVDCFFLNDGPLSVVEESAALLHWLLAFDGLGQDSKRLLDPDSNRRSTSDLLSSVRRYRDICEQLDALAIDPAGVVELIDGPGAPERWRALSALRDEAHRELASHGLVEQTVLHRSMIDSERLNPSAPRALMVLGVTDPGPLTVAVLEVLGDRVHLLVDAPESHRNDFDALGRPLPEIWCELPSPLPRESMRMVERPVDAGEVLIKLLEQAADADGTVRSDQLTVGLCDERYGELLERTGRRAGVPLRASVGISLSRTQPVRLLELLSRYLREPSLAEFSSLLRLPLWEEVLAERMADTTSIDLLSILDAWSQKRVGATLADLTSVPRSEPCETPPPLLVRVLKECELLLQPLRTCTSVSQQALALRSLFESAEEHSSFKDDFREFWKHAGPMFDALVSVKHMAALDCPALLELIHQQVARQSRPGEPIAPGQSVIEMVGWLDVRQDPARRIILIGFNEAGELAPPGVDAWLPDSLREQLGLPCESLRRARDAHALHALAARSTRLDVIASRVDVRGEPLVPSRLYLGPGGEEGAHRVLHTMEAPPFSRPVHLLTGMPRPAVVESFAEPQLPAELQVESLHVTDFEAWIRSPRRFWLERRLGLQTVEPHPLELDPRSFGTLAHDVLEEFGRSDLRDSIDAPSILDFLAKTLREQVRREYGDPCLPTIELQTRMLLRRLERFASVQADIAAQGWRCHAVERRLKATLELPDGPPVEIIGRVDRIDRHEDGRWRVLDYKTSINAANVSRKRTKDGRWKDLQLPLYDYLVRRTEAQLGDLVEVGYFAIPKELSRLQVSTADDWDASVMAGGVNRAREVVLEMRRGEFDAEPVTSIATREPDGIDRILRSSALEFGPDVSDEEGDE